MVARWFALVGPSDQNLEDRPDEYTSAFFPEQRLSLRLAGRERAAGREAGRQKAQDLLFCCVARAPFFPSLTPSPFFLFFF